MAAPLTVGVIPWGIVAGVAMIATGLTDGQAVAMSLLAFSGAAQLAVLPLLAAHAPLWMMYATAFLISLRYVIYSALLAPHFEHLPLWWRALLSSVLVDAIFALFIGRYQPDDRDACKHWFFLGASVAMYGVWQVSTWLGIFAGAAIPAEWSLEFAATLGLIATLVPLLLDRAVVAAALAGGAVSLVLLQAPLKLGLIVAVAIGVMAGLLATWLTGRRLRG